jgi:recombination protein RecT
MSKALAPIDEIRTAINSMTPQFKAALPPQVSPEKFVRVVLTAIQQAPSLLQCDRKSLYGAAMKAAQDGLLLDGREAAIVKFGDQAAYMPMIGGILKKIRNSGELSSITSQVVYEKDKFSYHVDLDGEHLKHEPNLFGDRGNPIGVYALAKTKDGGVYVEIMTVEQVMAVKKVSRSKDSGPWAGAFESEMWRKTVLRRLSKRLPMSTDLEGVLRRDDDLYDIEPTTIEPQVVEEIVRESKPRRLKKMIRSDKPVASEPETVASEEPEIPL